METDVNVKDAMVTAVVTVKKNTTISEAAEKMIEHQIGSLVVMDKNEPVGILTERDLVRVLAEKKDAEKTNVKDTMSAPIISVDPKTELFGAASIMSRFNIRRLPVMENNKLAGIITAQDILRFAPEEGKILSELAKINASWEGEENAISGECERCSNYTEYLKYTDGKMLCEDCREEQEE